jgi:hypothetical protein
MAMMVTQHLTGVAPDVTLKPTLYWPIRSSTRAVLAARVFSALALLGCF